MTQLTPEQFRSLEDLFEQLLDAPEAVIEQRLSDLAGQDPAVAAELRLLLDQRSRAEALDSAFQPREPSPPLGVGTQVGPFRITERLGIGGMGDVWAAEQTDPIERRVAIKIIRQGLPSARARQRFLAERQALAAMDHTNIAKVLEAGETEGGLPYLAMELVPSARTILQFAADHDLGVDDRLELFLQACDAIEHAHRKRIIHRDLKPSNVLVGDEDGRAVVKVIDFGIAKAMEEDLTGFADPATRKGDLVGTPHYMSPEQAALGAVDIDTRSDVYTLGLMLFELLVGELPLSAAELEKLPFDEALRRIRTADTPQPSVRARQLANTQPGSTMSSHWRRLQGDLDLILGKALAKDRSRRYGSAAELAEDVRRYLSDQPVLAAPPSRAYMLRKFVRRHRVATLFASLAAMGIVGALLGTSFGILQARAAEARAVASQARAETEARTAGQVSAFLEELLREGNPEAAQGAASVADLLVRGEAKLREQLADQPVVRARLLETVGRAFRALGDFEHAETLLRESLELRESTSGTVSEEVERSLSALSDLFQTMGRYDEANQIAQRQLDVAEAVFEDGSPRRVDAHVQVAVNAWRRGDYDTAVAQLDQAHALLPAEGPRQTQHLKVATNLGILRYQLGDYERAESLYREALAVASELHGDEHAQVASARNNLALLLERTGELEEARTQHEQALEIRRAVFGPSHPDVAESLNNLSNVYHELRRWEDAVDTMTQALEMRRDLFEAPNDLIATSEFNLGRLLTDRDPGRAEALMLSALDSFRQTLGDQHNYLSFPLQRLSVLAVNQRRLPQAVDYARQAVEIGRAALPPTHPRQQVLRRTLLDALEAEADPATEAERQELRAQLEDNG